MGAKCCKKISDAVCVPFSELHTFQPDVFLAMEDPSYLTHGYDDVYLNDYGQVDDVDPQIVRVKTNIKKSNDG